MLICGHCGDTVKDLHGLSVHLRCEEKPLPLVVVENTSTNTGSPKCEQCEHFDLSKSVYAVECYSCKRFCGDLFTLRASA